MGRNAELTTNTLAHGIMGSPFIQLAEELNGCFSGLNIMGEETNQIEEFSEEAFTAAFCMAASCDDPELLARISAIFSAHPSRAYAAVDRICEEKAREATEATQNGDYTTAAQAISEHHSMAMVYGKLISARLERLSSQV